MVGDQKGKPEMNIRRARKPRSFRLTQITLLLAAVLLTTSCFEEKRIVWSSDGSLAAILEKGGLHLADGDGFTSERVLDDVKRAVWVPHSRQLMTVRAREVGSWDEVAAALSPASQAYLTAMAEVMRTEFLEWPGETDDFESSTWKTLTEGEIGEAILYIRDYRSQQVREKLGSEWENLQDSEFTIYRAQIIEMQGGSANASEVLFESLDDIHNLRISPDGGAFAYVSKMPGEVLDDEVPGWVLWVAATRAGDPQRVSDFASAHADWSIDGRALIFGQAVEPVPHPPLEDTRESYVPGRLTRQVVRDRRGNLLPQYPRSQSLARVHFDDNLRVRSLTDGSFLVADQKVERNPVSRELEDSPVLHLIGAGSAGQFERVFSIELEDPKGFLFEYFDVSPDERLISIPGKGGRVAIVSLSDGSLIEILQERGNEKDSLNLPSWRAEDELSLALSRKSSSDDGQKSKILLWSPRGGRVIGRRGPGASESRRPELP